ncbi:MAG: DUF111 family protein [Firmicutes bacterium]|nr:DUF111 family protein [Bacillota bacterium]
MTEWHLEIFDHLHWEDWVAGWQRIAAPAGESAAVLARAAELRRRAEAAGVSFSSWDEVSRVLAALGDEGLTVGTLPLDPAQDYCQWSWLRGFQVALSPGKGVDARMALFLTVAARREPHPSGELRAVYEWPAEAGAPARARLFRWHAAASRVPAVLLSANIDDMTPEFLGYLLRRLMEAGARDAWVAPIVMKKSRAAHTVYVLAEPGAEESLVRVLFNESTTLGVRRQELETYILPREVTTVTTRFGAVRMKEGWFEGRVRSVHPEYDDCVRLAQQHGVPLMVVYRQAMAAWEATIGPRRPRNEGWV